MPRTVRVRLSGESERLFNDLEKEGLSERDVISRALGLLDLAYRSERVALLAKGPDGRFTNEVETVLVLGGLEKQEEIRRRMNLSEEEWAREQQEKKNREHSKNLKAASRENIDAELERAQASGEILDISEEIVEAQQNKPKGDPGKGKGD